MMQWYFGSGRCNRRDVAPALTPLVDTIADETMREANKMVDLEHKSVAEAARFL